MLYIAVPPPFRNVLDPLLRWYITIIRQACMQGPVCGRCDTPPSSIWLKREGPRSLNCELLIIVGRMIRWAGVKKCMLFHGVGRTRPPLPLTNKWGQHCPPPSRGPPVKSFYSTDVKLRMVNFLKTTGTSYGLVCQTSCERYAESSFRTFLSNVHLKWTLSV